MTRNKFLLISKRQEPTTFIGRLKRVLEELISSALTFQTVFLKKKRKLKKPETSRLKTRKLRFRTTSFGWLRNFNLQILISLVTMEFNS